MSLLNRFIDKCTIALKYLSLKLFTEWSRGEQHKARINAFAQSIFEANPDIQKVNIFFGFSSPYHEYPSWHIVGTTKDQKPFLAQIPHQAQNPVPLLCVWENSVSKAESESVYWQYTFGGALLSLYQQDRGGPLVKMAQSALACDPDNLNEVLNHFQAGVKSAFLLWKNVYTTEHVYRMGITLDK